MATVPSDSIEEKFARAAPTTSYGSRLKGTVSGVIGRSLRKFAGAVPGLSFVRKPLDEARLSPLDSGSPQLHAFYKADYGTPAKPARLEELPWGYIEENQGQIPFFGLREYWYPALMSSELPHNEAVPIMLLGDEIVLFRDADGSPAALENRCPHRNPLLSLGQVNVFEKGTITCRYHGMTFDKEGECVAFLADGPDSPACGKVKARSYPAIEKNDVIWLYMGVKDAPPIEDNLPRGRDLFQPGLPFRRRVEVPYSHLNILDNTVDMTHVGCLHRTCAFFGDQKLGGGVDYEELEGNGLQAWLAEPGGHAGGKAIDEIQWYLPNLVFHGKEFMDGNFHGMYFWFVPKDAGSFYAWHIATIDEEKLGKAKAQGLKKMLFTMMNGTEQIPGANCFDAGDGPMQMSQGRVARWDKEKLMRTDKAVVKARRMIKDAHKAEVAYRVENGFAPLEHTVSAAEYQQTSESRTKKL